MTIVSLEGVRTPAARTPATSRAHLQLDKFRQEIKVVPFSSIIVSKWCMGQQVDFPWKLRAVLHRISRVKVWTQCACSLRIDAASFSCWRSVQSKAAKV